MAEYRLLNYAGADGEARPAVSVGDRGRGIDKGRFLKAGDTVRITISGIDTLENKVVAS